MATLCLCVSLCPVRDMGEVTFDMTLETALHFSKALGCSTTPLACVPRETSPHAPCGWARLTAEWSPDTLVIPLLSVPSGGAHGKNPLRKNIPPPRLRGNPSLTLMISISSPSMWAKEENITGEKRVLGASKPLALFGLLRLAS